MPFIDEHRCVARALIIIRLFHHSISTVVRLTAVTHIIPVYRHLFPKIVLHILCETNVDFVQKHRDRFVIYIMVDCDNKTAKCAFMHWRLCHARPCHAMPCNATQRISKLNNTETINREHIINKYICYRM